MPFDNDRDIQEQFLLQRELGDEIADAFREMESAIRAIKDGAEASTLMCKLIKLKQLVQK